MKFFKKAVLLLAVTGILSAYACSKNDGNEPVKEPQKSEVPSALVGDWMESWSLYMQYNFDPLLYNPDTKVWFRGSHDAWSMDPRPGFGVRIGDAGDFIWAIVEGTGSGGCQIYTADYVKGTVSVEGNKITFYPQVRRQKYNSVCSPGNNFDRDEDKSSFTLTYALSTSNNNSGQVFDVLTFTSPDGSQIAFSKLKTQ